MLRSALAWSGFALLSVTAAQAGTDLNLPAFSAIEIHGGGNVIVHHGKAQRVTVIKGDLKVAHVTVSGNTLIVEPCRNWCWHTGDLEVDVTVPKAIDALTIHGGGHIEARGDFPQQQQLHVTVNGGGDIDAKALRSNSVWAEVNGGGAEHVNALNELNAATHGGGEVRYVGNPAQLRTNTQGGGDIRRE